MNQRRLRSVLCIFTALTIFTLTPAAEQNPLFSKLHGFGLHTPGGDGGKIIRVTNLNSKGPGSMREALQTKGPRIVVFEVGGVIDLQKKSISISEPFLTIAGQTAPSPGITLIRGGISIQSHDIVMQHIRVRPGDASEKKRSGWEPDGITTSAAYNVVIDHCSTTWAVDENLSVSGPRTQGPEVTSHDVTICNCIIAEGLNESSHAKGRHSKGTLVHDFCTNIAIIGNLYAHNVERNPYFKAFTTGVVVNNLIYNPGRRAVKVTFPLSEWKDVPITPQNCKIAVVGNVMMHGEDSRKDMPLVSDKGDVYLKDNIASNRQGKSVSMTEGKIVILPEPPVWPNDFTPLPAKDVIEHVLINVGARPKDRDSIDQRIIQDFIKRKGKIIDSQTEVGGYPDYPMTQRKLNIPDNNISAWLAKLAAELE